MAWEIWWALVLLGGARVDKDRVMYSAVCCSRWRRRAWSTLTSHLWRPVPVNPLSSTRRTTQSNTPPSTSQRRRHDDMTLNEWPYDVRSVWPSNVWPAWPCRIWLMWASYVQLTGSCDALLVGACHVWLTRSCDACLTCDVMWCQSLVVFTPSGSSSRPIFSISARCSNK